MSYFLLRMTVDGIKNIDNEITLDFYNNIVPTAFNPSNSHVKAIYGTNGAGKTALVYAISVYKQLMLDANYIALCNYNGELFSLINKKTHRCCIRLVFAEVSQEHQLQKIYAHTLTVAEAEEQVCILQDELYELVGHNISDAKKYRLVYSVCQGVLSIPAKYNAVAAVASRATSNLLRNQPFAVSFFLNTADEEKENAFGDRIMTLLEFAISLQTFFNSTDNNTINYLALQNQIRAINQKRDELDPRVFQTLLNRNLIGKDNCEVVQRSHFEEYKAYIERLCSFLQVFREGLESIDIKVDENGDKYYCEKVLVYEGGIRVNEKYESSGIKKLIEMYGVLCQVQQGSIVFADEFDANIHDVLLCRLVEYIAKYADGQFIFTTHNVGPMDVLRTCKHAIDFLSSDGQLVSWTIKGNASPASMYRNGQIEHSPFNLEAVQFLGVFGDVD